jgi:chromosome segregation ATPase
MEMLLNQLENELQKLARAYTRLKNDNNDLRKQQAVLEMEHTMLQEKYNDANMTIMNLTTQIGSHEDCHD